MCLLYLLSMEETFTHIKSVKHVIVNFVWNTTLNKAVEHLKMSQSPTTGGPWWKYSTAQWGRAAGGHVHQITGYKYITLPVSIVYFSAVIYIWQLWREVLVELVLLCVPFMSANIPSYSGQFTLTHSLQSWLFIPYKISNCRCESLVCTNVSKN